MEKRRIGVVEDEETLCREIVYFLESNGYEAVAVALNDYSVEGILKGEYDMVLLDLGLPDTDGMLLCKELRRVSQIPVIIITSRDTEITELMSMNYGADDFVAKPIRPQLLIAHMEAVFKRLYQGKQDRMYLDGFEFFPSAGMIVSGGKREELTKNELRILQTLAERRGSIVTREELMNVLWDNYLFVDDNTLTVNMARLRSKLESIGVCDRILTKRGMGYQLT